MNRTAPRQLALSAFAILLGVLVWRGPIGDALAHGGLTPRTRAVIDADGVVVSAFGFVRILVLVGCAALLLLGLLHLTAAWSGSRPLHALARGLTPFALRPFLGVVTLTTFAAPSAAGASTPPTIVAITTTTSPAPTMHRAPATTSATTSTTTSPATVAPATAVLDVAVVSPVHPKARPAAATPEPTPATWTVARGEHLWFVAEQVTSRTLGHAATEDEVAPYWRALVEANRDRLVDPSNPDLVHAGQELVLPAHPAARHG